MKTKINILCPCCCFETETETEKIDNFHCPKCDSETILTVLNVVKK